MSIVIQSIYGFLTQPSSDKLSYKHLPCHGAFLPVVLFNIAYLAFVHKIGPWFMKNRPPYNLKRVILCYNIGQIIYNTVMAYLGIYVFVIEKPAPFSCITPVPLDHKLKSLEILVSLMYASNKFLDYIETIFFVLRKSYKQVTFLHVYHHLMMASGAFLYLKYNGFGGHVASIGILNSIVHVFMYTYYLISSLSPGMKNSIWWKKYITRLQIAQFVILFIHQMWPLVVERDCAFPKFWCVISSIQAIWMTYLFGSFYIKAYIKKPNKDI